MDTLSNFIKSIGRKTACVIYVGILTSISWLVFTFGMGFLLPTFAIANIPLFWVFILGGLGGMTGRESEFLKDLLNEE